MPLNLLSFCISSTCNVLPSSSSLKCWEVDKVPSCSFCRKQLSTIACILGSCSISLQHGQFTFRHDSGLQCSCFCLNHILKTKPSDHHSRNKIFFAKLVTNNQNIKVTQQVDLFAVEVEASGYLSQSLNYLSIRFGCPNKL